MPGVEGQEPVPAAEPAAEGFAAPASQTAIGLSRTLSTAGLFGDTSSLVGYLAAAADEPRAEVVNDMQRTVGNRAVTRMLMGHTARSAVARAPSARAPTTGPGPPGSQHEGITPEEEEQMRGDVDFIVSKLREELLTAGEEQQILDRIDHWDMADHRALVDQGQPGTPHIDRLLYLLKTRVFTRSTASSFWIEQHANAFDELWRELEDDRLSAFSAIVARSKKQAATGPSSGPTENFWSTMGKQEAMGALGIVKGLVMGATGLVDAGSGGITALLKTVGVDAADPPKVAEWFGQQYDIMGREAFGGEWDEKLLGNMSAGDIGTFGGKQIWTLVMIGAGGQMSAPGAAGSAILPAGEAAASVQTALTAINIVGSFQQVRDSALGIVGVIERLQKADKLTAGALVSDPEFLGHVVSLGAAIYGAMAGGRSLDSSGGPSTPADAEKARWAAARVSALIEGAGAATQIGRIIEANNSDLPPKEKAAIIEDATQKLVEKLIAAAGALAGAHDDQHANDAFDTKREQQRQKALEEKQARYDAAEAAARPAAEARAEARAGRGELEGYQTPLETLAEAGPAPASERALDFDQSDPGPMEIDRGHAAVGDVPAGGAQVETHRHEDPGEVNTRRPRGFDSGRQESRARVKPGTAKGLEPTHAEATGRPGGREVTRDEQLHGVPSKEDWAQMRSGTPTDEQRALAQKALPEGSPDPAFPGQKTVGPAQPDHIVSVDAIRKMPGFAQLDPAAQAQVLNMPENFIALSGSANASKGSRSFENWTEHKSRGLVVNEAWRREMRARERALKPMIEQRISTLLRQQMQRESQVPRD